MGCESITTEINLGSKSVSVWLIVAFIAGIVAFITLFLNWETMTSTIEVIYNGKISESYDISAIDMLTGKFDGETVHDYSFFSKLPFIVALLGIIGAIVAILPIFVEGKNKEFSIALTVIFVICLVLCIVFFACGVGMDLFSGDAKTGLEMAKELGADISFKANVGLILAIVASVVGLIVSAINVKESL